MAHTQSLLWASQYEIDDGIAIQIPTVGAIYEYGENEYYRVLKLLTSVPFDLMVQLDDIGVDYETIDEYQLFLLLLFSLIAEGADLSILFGKSANEIFQIDGSDTVKLRASGKPVDRRLQKKIAGAIRRIHYWKKTEYSAGNKAGKEYLIERNRVKQRRAKNKETLSFLDEVIITLVNTEEFKYNYQQCLDLSIYQLNSSYHQIPKKKNWEQMMVGAYSGSVDLSKVDMEKIHWMSLE